MAEPRLDSVVGFKCPKCEYDQHFIENEVVDGMGRMPNGGRWPRQSRSRAKLFELQCKKCGNRHAKEQPYSEYFTVWPVTGQ